MSTETATLAIKIEDRGGIKTAILNLDELGKIGQSTEDKLKKIPKPLSEAEENAKKFGKAISKLNTALKAYLSLQVAGYIKDNVDGFTQLSGKLKLVTSSEEDLLSVRKKLIGVSNETRSSISDTGALYAKLALFTKDLGRSQAELLAVTETVQKTLKISGASTSEASAATLQFAQALSSGRLQGDEFRSIMENAPRLVSALTKELGITTGQLRIMATEGKLSADVIINALLRQKDAVDQDFSKIPKTIGDSITNVKNSFFQLAGTLNITSAISNGFNLLAGTINFVRDNMYIFTGLIAGAATLALPMLITSINGAVVAMNTLRLATIAFIVSNPFTVILAGFAVLFTGVITYSEKARNALSLLASGISATFQTIGIYVLGVPIAMVKAFISGFNEIKRYAVAFGKDFAAIFKGNFSFENLGKEMAKGFNTGFKSEVEKLKDVTKTVWNDALSGKSFGKTDLTSKSSMESFNVPKIDTASLLGNQKSDPKTSGANKLKGAGESTQLHVDLGPYIDIWRSAASTIESTMSNAFTNIFQQGKLDFASFASSIKNMWFQVVGQLITRFLVLKAISALGSFGLGMSATATQGGTAMSTTYQSSLGEYAGQVFQTNKYGSNLIQTQTGLRGLGGNIGNVTYHASGGIVDRATSFYDSKGSKHIMGEAGTEAILPVKRMDSGRYGVEVNMPKNNASGVNINVRVNAPIQISQNEKEDPYSTAQQLKELIEVSVINVLKGHKTQIKTMLS
jgi:tape measure domain-containing protein